jgi:hypothetical protein
MDWRDSVADREGRARQVIEEDRRRQELCERFGASASNFLSAKWDGTLGFLFRDGCLFVEFRDDRGETISANFYPSGSELDSLASNLTDPRLRDLMGVEPSRLGGTAGAFVPGEIPVTTMPASPLATYSVSTAGPRVATDPVQIAFHDLCRTVAGAMGSEDELASIEAETLR